MAKASTGRGVATIERATDVLFLFAEAPGTLGVTDIANELQISKAVVHRIVTSLCDQGLVTADPVTRRYSLGPAVIQLASAYLDKLDVRAIALDAMHELMNETNETATLSIRNGDQRVYVDQVTPPREVKMTVKVAASFPLHAGASSKAFLAWLGDDEIERYLTEHDLEALTDLTIVSESDLRAELQRIRQQGFAVSLGERQRGAGSVAAPVLDHTNQPVAVISVCGPVERFREEVASSAAALVSATRELSARLGARPSSGG
ncbi:MAG: IclR family transcriptional regulator [Acidimicrobiales bacterium]